MSSLQSLLHLVLHKIQSLKSAYNRMSPKGKWEILRQLINFWLICTGLAVLDRKFKVNLLSYLTGALILDYYILMIYTSHKYMSDPLRAIQTTCVLGVLIPVNMILNLFLSNRTTIFTTKRFSYLL